MDKILLVIALAALIISIIALWVMIESSRIPLSMLDRVQCLERVNYLLNNLSARYTESHIILVEWELRNWDNIAQYEHYHQDHVKKLLEFDRQYLDLKESGQLDC